MKFKKVCLSKGIKASYQETFDLELAEIASSLFIEDISTKQTASYKLKFLKARHNCKTYILTRGNEVYFLKKFFEPSLRKKLLNVFRTSKAFRCYSTSCKLTSIKIPVAEPVMYLTYSKRIIEKESIFVNKKAAGINLANYLLSPDIPLDKKAEAAKRLFQLLGYFYKKRYKHGDPCLPNYLIDPRNGNDLITFIDLDHVHRMPYMPVYIALHGLTKISSLGGSMILGKEWSSYVKTFLDAFNPQIELDKAMRVIEEDKKRI